MDYKNFDYEKAVEAFHALGEGRKIFCDEPDGTVQLSSLGQICKAVDAGYAIRIEPLAGIRPYAFPNEFLLASSEHGPYLSHKGSICFVLPVAVYKDFIILIHEDNYTRHSQHYSYDELLSHFEWADGAPCGIDTATEHAFH